MKEEVEEVDLMMEEVVVGVKVTLSQVEGEGEVKEVQDSASSEEEVVEVETQVIELYLY